VHACLQPGSVPPIPRQKKTPRLFQHLRAVSQKSTPTDFGSSTDFAQLSLGHADIREEGRGGIVDIRTLDKDQLRDLWVSVFKLARKLIGGNKQAAKDLTQLVFLRVATTSPWSPRGKVGLEDHLFGILRSVRSNEEASNAKRRENERRATEEWAALSEAGRSAEQLVLDHAERERAERLATERVAKLRARIAGYPLDLSIVDHMMNEVTKRSDLVALTGRSPDEVKTALARIRRHMDAIVAAEGGEDEDKEVES
jgi:DNA-directed RNA polymerase specialized sigma24 family protein